MPNTTYEHDLAFGNILPFKKPQILSKRDLKALNSGNAYVLNGAPPQNPSVPRSAGGPGLDELRVWHAGCRLTAPEAHLGLGKAAGTVDLRDSERVFWDPFYRATKLHMKSAKQ